MGKGNALEQAEACARGRGVKQDRIAAEALYQQAVQEKLPGTHFRMGLFYHHQPGRDAEAAEAYFNAFLDGDLCAKVALKELIRVPSVAAYCYLGKIFEAEGNRLEARKAYQAAIDGGSAIAIFHLAKWHEADPTHRLIALREYQRAWFNGFTPALAALEEHAKTNPAAALLLGEGYERAKGDYEKNISIAYRYYLCALHSGCLDTLDSLERLAETGTREMKAGLVQLYRSPDVHRPMEALRWEAKMRAAPTSSTLTYASPAVTTFLRPTVMRKTAGDLSTKIHQLSLGAN